MTSDRELGFTPTHKLREMIVSKEISPVELTESHIRRADELDPKLGIFITRTSELAMDAAREAEAAVMRGDGLGPLHGIPVPYKDTEPMKGVVWTHGSLTYKNNIAEVDSIPLSRVKAAGAIITGKAALASEKNKALEAAGVHVVESPALIGAKMKEVLG